MEGGRREYSHVAQGLLSLTGHQIIYVAIVGAVMLAAFLEWILWLAAFLYCLIKVFQKAENVSIRVLSSIMMILFTIFRYFNLLNQLVSSADHAS